MKKNQGILVAMLVAVGSLLVSCQKADRRVSQDSALPGDYETWNGSRKRDFLWRDRIIPSKHAQLPPMRKADAVGLVRTAMALKMATASDEAPTDWKKAIHAVGTVAAVKFVLAPDSPFTGLFQGADCGLIRLSLTYAPVGGKPVAPGFALKLFVDGKPSVNVSALVSLDGQGEDYNFFTHEFTNIVPASRAMGNKIAGWLFSRVSNYPREIYLREFAEIDQKGGAVAAPVYPFQVFFVPTPQVQQPSQPAHDFRDDMARIPAGTVLFQVFASVPAKGGDDSAAAFMQNHNAAKTRQTARLIGRLETTSEFVASEFGDSRLFFRHQRYANR